MDTKKICLNQNNEVKKCLIHKYNKLNVHLNWEPMIQDIINSCGFKFVKFEKKYLETMQKLFYTNRTKRNKRRMINKKTIKKLDH